MANGKRRQAAFTLIELLVVLTIISLLIVIVSPRYLHKVDEARRETLQQQLRTLQQVLDDYYADHNHYPRDLQNLVSEGYLRDIPIDPYTERSDSWTLIYETDPEGSGIRDVRSGHEPEKG